MTNFTHIGTQKLFEERFVKPVKECYSSLDEAVLHAHQNPRYIREELLSRCGTSFMESLTYLYSLQKKLNDLNTRIYVHLLGAPDTGITYEEIMGIHRSANNLRDVALEQSVVDYWDYGGAICGSDTILYLYSGRDAHKLINKVSGDISMRTHRIVQRFFPVPLSEKVLTVEDTEKLFL